MKKYKPTEDGRVVVDPYMSAMNKENNGYHRFYGKRVTNRLIKKWVVVMHHTCSRRDLWNHKQMKLKEMS